jgi:HAD superfamily hydrolase (TIGR01484 family)
MNQDIKVIAMDLDGTLSQHKTMIPEQNREILEKLAKHYKLLMVGAGKIHRIFNQLGRMNIDIIGNYGMQYGVYNAQTGDLDIVRDDVVPCDREKVARIADSFREKYGFTQFTGEAMEFHDSGCVTFPLLGTKAALEDKLAFDPDRSKRRAFYHEVVAAFDEYCVFVGGTSSFDMAPKPYNKYFALDRYCRENGLSHSQVVFIGDDYGLGGNDEPVYKSDFNYITIDNYLDFPERVKDLL